VIASPTSHPDLFWALRGAGVFFGVVVEAEYKTYPLTNNGIVGNWTGVYPLGDAKEVLGKVCEILDDGATPKEVMVSAACAWQPEMGMALLLLDVVAPLPEADFETTLRRIRELEGKPLVEQTLRLELSRLLDEGAMGIDGKVLSRAGQWVSVYGMCAERVDLEKVSKVAKELERLYREEEGARGSAFNLEFWGDGQVEGKGSEEGALFAWKGTKAFLQVLSPYAPLLPSLLLG
jgi:hypothetical protein